MKKILITGSEGFIGSHLVERLMENKAYQLHLLVQYNSFSNKGWLNDLKLAQNIKIIYGDIRDEIFIDSIVKNMDYVFHLAALISIPYSYQSPKEFINTNVVGSLNIFNACLKHKVKKIIHTSTSEVYGSAQYTPIDEKHPLVGQSPYSASKISADNLALAYNKSYNLPVIIIRPFNCFGPRQSLRAIIPSLINQCLNYNTVKVGDLSTIRDFTYVKDTAQAFENCLKYSVRNFGEIINVGSGKSFKIRDILGKITKIVGKKINIKVEKKRIRPKKSEVYKLLSSTSKSKKILRWKAYSNSMNFDQALFYTINWYKKNKNKFIEDTQNYNL